LPRSPAESVVRYGHCQFRRAGAELCERGRDPKWGLEAAAHAVAGRVHDHRFRREADDARHLPCCRPLKPFAANSRVRIRPPTRGHPRRQSQRPPAIGLVPTCGSLERNRGRRGSVIVAVWPIRRGRPSDLVAVGDDECPSGGESIVNGLDVCGAKPDRGTDAGLSNGCEIGAGNDVAECERDRLPLEDDGVRRPGL
jgi:hypothetical protein